MVWVVLGVQNTFPLMHKMNFKYKNIYVLQSDCTDKKKKKKEKEEEEEDGRK